MNMLAWSRAALFRLISTRTGVLVLATGGTLILRTVSTVLLTRLLSPEAFGIVAIVMAILFTLTMLTDLGFQSFVVRHERGDEVHFRNVIWTIHAGRGAILTVLAVVTAPLAAWALGKPVLTLPLAAASVYFFLSGITSLSIFTTLRHDGARKLILIDFALQVFQTISCLLLALWWRNVWSVIVALLLQWSLRAWISFRLFADSSHRPARDRALSKEFFAFSKIVMMSSTLTLLIAQSDKLLLARLFTLDNFGIYAIAISIVSAPVTFVHGYITRVVYPVYANLWRTAPKAIAEVYYKVRRLPSLLYAFACGGLIGGSDLIVRMLYDPRYSGAAIYITLLGIASALRLPNFAAAELMTAIGRIKSTLYGNVIRVCWLALTIPLGFLWLGPTGIVAAVGLMEFPVLLYSWAVLRQMGFFDLREEFLFLVVACAGATAGCILSFEALRILPKL